MKIYLLFLMILKKIQYHLSILKLITYLLRYFQ